MITKKEISVVIPVYNEEEIISETVSSVFEVLNTNFDDFEIILVNDASTDKTKLILDSLKNVYKKITIINNPSNLGIWNSWKIGTTEASFKCICIIDADLQYQPSEIIKLYKMHLNGYQFVQGYRKFNAENSYLRLFFSKFLSILLKLVFRKYTKNLIDIKSGFFVTRKSLLISIFNFFPLTRFGQTFIVVYANFLNAFVKQMPVTFSNRTKGKSFLGGLPIVSILKVLGEIFYVKFKLRKFDYYLIIVNYYCKEIPKYKFKFFEKIKLKIFFKTTFLHKWKIGKNLESYLYSQLKFQELDKESVEIYQLNRLKDLVWYYYQNSGYFKEKMSQNNTHPYDITDLSDLKLLPILSKNEVKIYFSDNLLSDKLNYFNSLFITTSGSTGLPINLYANSEQLKVRWANTFRGWMWAGWTPGEKQARLWHQTIGMTFSQVIREFVDNLFFKRIFVPAYNINKNNIDKFLKKIISHKPFVIDGYAESFNFLLEYCRKNKIKNFNVSSIISSAQEMPKPLKEAIKKELGANVYDKYGAREFSGIAYESVNNFGHLICDDSYIVELLKNKEDVGEGEIGEVIITDLNNLITPFIRYKIGDLAKKVPIKEFSRNKIKFNVIGDIEGRTKAIILGENGKWIPGTFFAHFFKEYSNLIDQYQVIQKSKSQIIFNMKLKKEYELSDIEYIFKKLKKTTGDLEFNINKVDDIPYVRTGKIMGSISYLDNEDLLNN